ncbi:MAG: putative toxin-antitoxin system toxin component, PIN family [Bryobacteraceae bacterium]
MLRATLDTSVYIRALHLAGRAAIIIGHARVGNIGIDTSEAILNETIGVLRDTFGWSGYALHDMREKLGKMTKRVTPAGTLDVIKHDPPDNRILECAVEAKSDYIVSEDNDLLRLKQYSGIRIVTVAEFLEAVVSQQRGR